MIEMNRGEILAMPQPVINLILHRFLEQNKGNVSEKMIRTLFQFLQKGSGAVEISKGIRFVVKKEVVLIQKDLPEIPYFSNKITLSNGDLVTKIPLFGGKSLIIRKIVNKNGILTEKFYNMYLKNAVDCDRIGKDIFAHQPQKENTITIQQKEQGIIPRYRCGTKGKTSGEISRMVVLQDEHGTIWAEKLGTNETRQCSNNSKSVYFFEIMEEE